MIERWAGSELRQSGCGSRVRFAVATYKDAIEAGVKAFELSGKKMTKAKVRQVFPENDHAMAGLIFFIWDATQNGFKSTRRIQKQLGHLD